MLPMVACVISLDSPTVMLARKSLNSDLRGSLILPHCGSLHEVVKSSKSMYKIYHKDQIGQLESYVKWKIQTSSQRN